MAYLIRDTKSRRQPAWIIRFRNLKNAGLYTNLTIRENESEARKALKKYTGLEAMEFEYPRGVETLLVPDLVEKYLSKRSGELSGNGAQTYRYMLKHFSTPFNETELWSITPEGYTEWSKTERQACKTTATYNAVIRHVRSFLNWAEASDYIGIAPVLVLADENTDLQRGEWLERDQIDKILEAATPDMRDYYTILLSTGARAREILKKPWDHWHDGYIELLKTETRSRKPERLWLNAEAGEILARRKLKEERMFDFSYYTVRGSFRRIQEETGIQFTPQDLRKTCGYLLLQSGVDLYQVSQYLRHADVRITKEQYASILLKDYHHLAEILDGSHPHNPPG
jgi:integrase